MKKIILRFFLFCILWVSQTFASTGVLSSTCSYNISTDTYTCFNWQSVNYDTSFLWNYLDVSFNFNLASTSDTSAHNVFRYSCYLNSLCAAGGYPSANYSLLLERPSGTSNKNIIRLSVYSSWSLIYQSSHWISATTSTKYRLFWEDDILRLYINDVWIVNTTIWRNFVPPISWASSATILSNQNLNTWYFKYLDLKDTSWPQLECQEYTETQTISSPWFIINSYLTGSDTTSLLTDYDVAYTEVYDEMIVNYFDFQTLSTESFSTTWATLLGTTFPLKYPTLSFSAYNSDDADYTIHDWFIFNWGVLNNPPNISENSFEYVKIRDWNDKEIYLDEIIQGKKYLIPWGVKDVEFKFKRSWYQVFDTHIIFDFQFINYSDIEVEKTFCVDPSTWETYIDGVLSDYRDIDDIPKISSEIEIIQWDMISEPSVDSWTGTTSTISLESFGASYESDPKCSVDNSKYKWDSYQQLALVDKVFLPVFNTLIVPIKCYFLTFVNIFDYKSWFDFAIPFVGTLEKWNPLGEAVGIAFVFLATISFFKLLPNSKN